MTAQCPFGGQSPVIGGILTSHSSVNRRAAVSGTVTPGVGSSGMPALLGFSGSMPHCKGIDAMDSTQTPPSGPAAN